jgi:hypothetical protein
MSTNDKAEEIADEESDKCEIDKEAGESGNQIPPKKLTITEKLWIWVRGISPIIFFAVFASFLTNTFFLGEKYVEKSSIEKHITSLVNNGAGLRAVKFYYSHRKTIKRDILFALKQDVSLYYSYDVALSEILEQLRTEQFLNGEPDHAFLEKLNLIIREYTESNPFDKLEIGQKDLFENIRVKLSNNYPIVSDDINKLSDELSSKNKLVNEYLSDSQTSLIISIVSAFIAVVLAAIQMWQSSTRTRSYASSRGYYAGRRSKEYVLEGDDGVNIRRHVNDDGTVTERVYSLDGTIIRKIKKRL